MTKRLVLAAVLLTIVVAIYLLSRPTIDRKVEAVATLPVPVQKEQVSVAAGSPVGNVAQAFTEDTPQSRPEAGTAPQETMPPAPPDPVRTEAAPPQPLEEVAGPAEELENVQFMVRGYRDALGENPVGNNLEITKALMGDNARQVKMPMPAGSRLNDQGELTDRWGSPYFFHQLSAKEMEIRSAGPDQRMWTPDDLLAR